ncbi:MAG: hypothetical protein QXU32_01930 [Nitrososphaerales archaeon]
MAVNPVTPPVPPNSNYQRAMYIWLNPDPIGTDANLQNLLNFSRDNGVNCWFLDMWSYLGGSNYTTTKQSRMQLALDNAHKSGITVYALCGNTDWPVNQQWVMKNIIQPLRKFNNLAVDSSKQFDGIHFDVEYWTDQNLNPAVYLPGLCDLAKAARKALDKSVGCFASFFLKDNSGTRPPINYNGKSAQDGEHMMDVFDHVVVGAYRDHADDNGTDGPGQKTLFQPWYDYAAGVGRNFGLFCGSETMNVSPSYITYYGQGKTYMEQQHTLISQTFAVPTNAVFLGQAIHNYDSYRSMGA